MFDMLAISVTVFYIYHPTVRMHEHYHRLILPYSAIILEEFFSMPQVPIC